MPTETISGDVSEALLPCPFCGADPQSVPQNSSVPLDNGGWFQFIWCENCDAQGGGRRTDEKAVEAWNTRQAALQSASPRPTGDVVEALDRIKTVALWTQRNRPSDEEMQLNAQDLLEQLAALATLQPADPVEPKVSSEAVAWECFSDVGYWDMWCVREVGEKRWGHGFHVSSKLEAEGLTALLNEQAASDHALLTWQLKALAVALHDKHFSDNPVWRPLNDALGILSQIDNMTTGLTRASDPSRELVERVRELEALASQYLNDLQYPPAEDSRQRRIDRIRAALAQSQSR